MTSLISLDKKSRKALLDSIATLTGFFWRPDSESSRRYGRDLFSAPWKG